MFDTENYFRCPQCQSDGPFRIRACSMFEVHGDGQTGDFGDVEWEDDSRMVYGAGAEGGCGYAGVSNDFVISDRG